jgi:hypothetical protein
VTTQTQAPAALAALVTTWTTALASYGDRLLVSDGPPITDRSREIEVWVGATGDETEETVITGAQDWVTFGDAANDRDEQLDIQNAIWVFSTSTIAAARQTAFDVFNAAITAVRGTDLSIGPVDPTAAPTSWELRQGQYSTGPGVRLLFTLHLTGQL